MKSKINSIFLVSLMVGMIGFSIGGMSSTAATSISWFFFSAVASFSGILIAASIESLGKTRLQEAQRISSALVFIEAFQATYESTLEQSPLTQTENEFTHDN
ncbi:hypothetical protein [Leucothrix mucor]|uniref:hypothetical protein n=1 Tax=Leucothrix mucor TaxID=45248 RepID=UPI0003B4087D|nr:hypothetical protein [Leucothrix mucor]